jgi:hypothetical protein
MNRIFTMISLDITASPATIDSKLKHVFTGRTPMIKQLLLALSLLGLLTGCIITPSYAQSGTAISIAEGGGNYDYDCNGGDVYVSGSGNTVNLHGQCGTLFITGATNVITVDIVTAINLTGANNHIMWKAATSGAQPVIANTGVDNIVEQVVVGATTTQDSTQTTTQATTSAANLEIDGTGITQTYDCNNNDVQINGVGNTITLHGVCNDLQVNGSNQTVTVDVVASIQINGTNSTVMWKQASSGAEPEIEVIGLGNKVTRIQ